jgi:hypothetical protein
MKEKNKSFLFNNHEWRKVTKIFILFLIKQSFSLSIIHSMQTDSECESDVSSIADSSTNPNQLIINREHLIKRIDSLTQENRVLKVELETYKLRLKASQQEIKQLKQFSFSFSYF